MKRWLLLLVLFGMSAKAQVPKTEDSLKVFLASHKKDTLYVDALNEFAFIKVQQSDFAEVEKRISEMDALSKKLKYATGYYKVVNMRGIVEYSHQNFDKAMALFLDAQKVIEKYSLSKKRYQTSLNNIMIIYGDLGNREKATEFATRLIAYQEKHKLKPYRSSPYMQLGNNLKFYGKPLEALPYYEKALAIETEIGSLSGIAIGENALGNLYDDLKDDQKALSHFKKGLAAAEKADYKLLQTDLLVNLARIEKHLKNYDLAEKHLLKSEKICKEIEVVVPLKTLYHNLGDVYVEQRKFDKAETAYLKALEIAKTMQDPEVLYTINQALSDFMHERGNAGKAYDYLVSAQTYKDSTFKIETAKTTEEMLRKYEAREKQQQISALSARNKISQLQIENATKQQIFLVSGIVLLIVSVLLIFRQSRIRKKNNQKLTELNSQLDKANKDKALFLGILNHDLKSPVSSLISFLRIQKENPEALDESTKIEMQEKTIASAENLLESMEDILVWSKGQMQHFAPEAKKIDIDWIFDDLERHFSHIQKVSLKFENDSVSHWFTDENYLKTILRNLIANAVNALENTPEASVVISAKNDEILVKDNGNGMTSEAIKNLFNTALSGSKSGLGMYLIRDMADAINCEISVASEIGKGTTFTLRPTKIKA